MRIDPSTLHGELRAVFDGQLIAFRTLEDVVHWAFALTPPSEVADIVVQDEFTHDVVVPWRGHWLVFDTT